MIALSEMNDSGQTGIAILTARGDKTEVVLLATAGISQANHIHTGSCKNLGSVAYPLTDMANGRSVTTVDVTLASLRTGGFAINLHNATNASIYTSCGDLLTQQNTVTIALAEVNDSGQTGVATLVANGQQTEVTILATVGISPQNHIHKGSCADLGSVPYTLTDMVAGTSVTMVDASLNSLLTGTFAINLYKIGETSVYTACGNIS